MTTAIEPLNNSIVGDSRAAQAGQFILIFLAGLLIYGWKVGVPPIAGTEPLRALVAHQMVESGELLIPRLNGELYLRKPPLQYWVVAATEKLIGVGNEWVWRLPSVIASALLAVFLAWWAARWFGDSARLVSGFACLGLIALWAQDRGADIDALDTATAVFAACCVLEMGMGAMRRPWVWMVLLGISSGAMLLLKGPAGLPPIISAVVGCALIARGRRSLGRPWIWVGLVMGAMAFGAYWLAVHFRIQSQHLVMDYSGVQEAKERMFVRSWAAVGMALLVPIRVLVYALPVSVGMVIAIWLSKGSVVRERVMAIVSTIVGSLLIGVMAGTTNPRYSYVSLPLLAPLVGVAGVLLVERGKKLQLMKGLGILCVVWVIAHVVLTIMAFKKIGKIDVREHVGVPRGLLIGVMAAAVGVCVFGLISGSLRRRAWCVALLIVLLGIPFAEMKNAERTQFSGRAAGVELRQALGGPVEISVAAVNRDLPQIFYYADVPVHAFGEMKLANLAEAPGERWVVLSEPEFEEIQRMGTGSLSKVTALRMPNDTLYLAWYSRGGAR